MVLSAKDRRTLRSLGQKLPEGAQLGTAGITDAFVAHVSRLLAERELVKVRLGDTEVKGQERAALAERICAAVEAECVAVVGRVVVLYRANPALEPKARVLQG